MTKEQFCKDMTNDNNHRLLLWSALKATKGNVVEFGSGWGSTQYLRKYCKDSKRTFLTFDYTEDWAKLHQSTFVNDWAIINPTGGVILIDHSPGEQRYKCIQRLKDNFDIFVLHDSEPVGAGDYKYQSIYPLFKYRADVKTDGAWATALSNTIDVTQFKGETYNEFTIS
jgi:hypothetical protein